MVRKVAARLVMIVAAIVFGGVGHIALGLGAKVAILALTATPRNLHAVQQDAAEPQPVGNRHFGPQDLDGIKPLRDVLRIFFNQLLERIEGHLLVLRRVRGNVALFSGHQALEDGKGKLLSRIGGRAGGLVAENEGGLQVHGVIPPERFYTRCAAGSWER